MTSKEIYSAFWAHHGQGSREILGSSAMTPSQEVEAYQAPLPGNLPTIILIGVDFTGPIHYTAKPKTESKAYLAVYACSLTRAVHLDLLKSLEMSDFIASLK